MGIITDQTKEQEQEYLLLHQAITVQFGASAADAISAKALKSFEESPRNVHMHMKDVYDLAIKLSKEKLKEAVITLDESEYHEIMKAHEIMENL